MDQLWKRKDVAARVDPAPENRKPTTRGDHETNSVADAHLTFADSDHGADKEEEPETDSSPMGCTKNLGRFLSTERICSCRSSAVSSARSFGLRLCRW